MAGTVDAVIIFTIIVIIILVMYLGVFHKPGKSDPNNQYVTPAGFGNQCRSSSDCPAGMYCTQIAQTSGLGGTGPPNPPTIPSTCSPYCATYYDNTGTYHDTCSVGFTPSATCVWNPAPVRAYNCQQKACSTAADCASSEICSPNASGASVCYPADAPCSTVGSSCFGTSSLICTVATSEYPTCQAKSS